MKYCYSYDEENYVGDFDSREEAYLEAEADQDEEQGIWTGVIKPAVDFLEGYKNVGDDIVERLDEQLWDDISSEDAIMELSSGHCDELGKMVVEFLKENASFNSWGVTDIVQHEHG